MKVFWILFFVHFIYCARLRSEQVIKNAIENRNADALDEQLSKIMDIGNFKVNAQPILFYICAGSYDETLVQVALKHGAHPNHSGYENILSPTVLHLKAMSESVSVTDSFLNADRSSNLYTPLHMAVLNGNLAAVQALFSKCADPNIFGPTGYNALHLACSTGHKEVAKTLISNGAAVDMTTQMENFTPLHIASLYGHLDIATLLLEKGASIESLDKDNQSPFSLACLKSNLEVANALVQKGASVDIPACIRQNTPLHMACFSGRVNSVKFLLLHGASVDQKNSDLNTALHMACYSGDVEIVELLLSKAAHLDSQNIFGFTPLHVASKAGHIKAVKLLLAHKANPYVKTNAGKTSIDLAMEDGNFAVATLLLIVKDPGLD